MRKTLIVLLILLANGLMVSAPAADKPVKKWGFIDPAGTLVISPQFTDAHSFSEDLAAVKITENKADRWGFIDRSGRFVIAARFASARPFHEGLACVSLPEKPVEYGFIDKTGQFVIQPGLNYGGDFHEGLAWVILGRQRMGYIDRSGKVVIKGDWEDADDFCDGLAKVVVGERAGYIDRQGRQRILHRFDQFSADFQEAKATVVIGERTGAIDTTGAYLVPPEMADMSSFRDGRAGAAVFTDDPLPRPLWGIIDETGCFVLPPRFDRLSPLGDGLWRVNEDIEYHYYDKRKYVSAPPGAEEKFFQKIWVGEDRYMFFDTRDYTLTPPVKDLHLFLCLPTTGRAGVIDSQGKWLIPAHYYGVWGLSEGTILVQEATNRFVYLDRQGKPTHQRVYVWADLYNQGLARVQVEQ